MDKALDVKNLQKYYNGFYLKEPVGNNAFSFEGRECKEIYVPPLIAGGLEDVRVGGRIVFSEIVDGQEHNSLGLESFVYWQHEDKDIFIFDNHNHAFSFWNFGLKTGVIFKGDILVHVDQHKDTRQPDAYLERDFWKDGSIEQACHYANTVVNVGNFIDPALRSGVFSELIVVDNDEAFEQQINPPFALDIDLDIFSPDMDYISKDKKVSFIRNCIKKSSFVTIATSPHFIDQKRAIDVLKELF